MIKRIVLISLLISISGCASWFSHSTKIPETALVINEVERPKLNIPMPSPLKLRPFTWIIITQNNQDTIWKQLKNTNKEAVLFGIIPDDYENMSLNLKEIEGFYLKQREIINQYKSYYEPINHLKKKER